MAADDAGHGGQADAVAAKLLRLVQTLEGSEQPAGVLAVEADAVVAYEADLLAVDGFAAELDFAAPVLVPEYFQAFSSRFCSASAQQLRVAICQAPPWAIEIAGCAGGSARNFLVSILLRGG
jgi:hypothetical protein